MVTECLQKKILQWSKKIMLKQSNEGFIQQTDNGLIGLLYSMGTLHMCNLWLPKRNFTDPSQCSYRYFVKKIGETKLGT